MFKMQPTEADEPFLQDWLPTIKFKWDSKNCRSLPTMFSTFHMNVLD